MNLDDGQKRWLAWGIVAVVLTAVSIFLGVSYPVPEPPLDVIPPTELVTLGVTHFSGMEISGNETDELVVNQTSTGDIVEFRDNGTVVWRLADGGAVTHVGTLDVQGDITLENDETLSNATDGFISLGGGLIYASLEITPTAMANGEHFTPTVTSLYIINSSGAVSMTLGACSNTGQILLTYGDDANNVTINDTNVRTNDGSAQVLGQYDLVTWMCIGTGWVEVSESNNS